MKAAKLLREGCRTAANLLRPRMDMTEGFETLESLWPDTKGECYVDRPADWLTPEKPVALSVIIPAYNNAPFLRGCLDSVLGQTTGFSFEAIVIDDGSTDETAEILTEYAGRILAIRQENKGHSGARNAGLEICRGEYILFHDSDDTLCPGALEALMTCAKEKNADIVAGGYDCKPQEGEPYPGLRFPAAEVTDPETVPGMTCGKIFRRSLFAHCRFPLGYWYEDSVICQILLPLAKRIYTVEAPVFTYLLNPQGVSAASQGKKKAVESLYVTRALLAEKPKFGLPWDEAAYRHFLHMVLLTYHRTRLLDKEISYAVFLGQRQLQKKYFAGVTPSDPPLAAALEQGNYRKYLWLCETLWLRK